MAVDGIDGSGKSRFAAALAEGCAAEGVPTTLLHVDDYRRDLDFSGLDVFYGDVVQVAVGAGEEHDHLLGDGHRLVLILLEQFGHPLAAFELVLGALVEIGRELGEGGQLPVLGEVES